MMVLMSSNRIVQTANCKVYKYDVLLHTPAGFEYHQCTDRQVWVPAGATDARYTRENRE